MERLQRILAARGISSRRAAEELITAGRVSVDGQIVRELGVKADPEAAVILVDGNPIRKPRPRYLILNKPSGYITTMKDERDRWTVMRLMNVTERVYPVGRLDRDTEGLLLFTNDGDVANRVMHPKYGLAKEYHVLTMTRPSPITLQRLRDGVVIDGKTIVPKEIRLLRETREGLILTITVHEGINRLVRRMMEAAGIPITKLRRVRVGPLGLASLGVGESRDLTMGEVATLMEALHIDDLGERPLHTGPTPYRPGPRKDRPRPEAPSRPPVTEQRVQQDVRPPAGTGPGRPVHNRNGQPRDDRRSGDARPFNERRGITRDAQSRGDERNQERRAPSNRSDGLREDHRGPRAPFPNRDRSEGDDHGRGRSPAPDERRFDQNDRSRDDDRSAHPNPFPNRRQFGRDDGQRQSGRSPLPERRPFEDRGDQRSSRQFKPREDEATTDPSERKPFNDQRGRHTNYRQAREQRGEPLKGSDVDGAPSDAQRNAGDRSRSKPTSPYRDRRTGGGGQNNRRKGPGGSRRRDLP